MTPSIRRIRPGVVSGLLAAVLLVVLPPPAGNASTTPSAAQVVAPQVTPASTIRGVDTSHFQHPNNTAINWAAVAGSGRSFAFMKATQGTTFVDPFFATDLTSAAAVGLYRAPYHFLTADDPAAQATFFIQTIRNDGYTGHGSRDLPPAIDVEFAAGGGCPGFTAASVLTFANLVRSAFGRTPVLYTQQSFVNGCLGGSSALAGMLLWTIDLSQNPPRLAPGYTTWTFWQFGTATVPGISAAADTDAFNGSLAGLASLTGAGTGGFGYYNPADGTMHVRNALNSSGPWDAQWVTNWPAGAVPLTGDWDGM